MKFHYLQHTQVSEKIRLKCDSNPKQMRNLRKGKKLYLKEKMFVMYIEPKEQQNQKRVLIVFTNLFYQIKRDKGENVPLWRGTVLLSRLRAWMKQ